MLAVRELSDRCEHCLAHRWAKCTNAEAGPWRYITMRLKAGSKVAKTRSQCTVISTERVNLARAVAPAEVIALESADDPEVSSFWLALAEGPAFVHTGPRKPRMDALWSRAGTTSRPLLRALSAFFFLGFKAH